MTNVYLLCVALWHRMTASVIIHMQKIKIYKSYHNT